MRCAVCIPIGPGDADARRLRTVVESLFRHEPSVRLLVVADASGGDATANLRELVPPSCQGVRLDCLAAAGGDCTPATLRLMALRYFADRSDYDVCVQLETTSLVICPFAARLGRYFAARPAVGQAGRVSDGVPSDGPRAVQWRRLTRLKIGRRAWRERGRDRRLQRLAEGRENGSHCLAGATALTRQAVASLEKSGLLAREWPATADPARLTSALVLAVGWSVGDHAAAGEVFGVAAAGLPVSPRQLVADRYAIVSDVTNDSHHSEREIVGYFTPERDAAAA